MMEDANRRLREQVLEDVDTPEAVRRALEGGANLESIVLDELGRWWHQGERFVNEKLSALFSESVWQTEGGVWFLAVGSQSYPVTILGAGHFCERLEIVAKGATLTLTTGEVVEVGSSGWMTDGASQIGVQAQDGRHVRFIGAAHQLALDRVEERDGAWTIRLASGTAQLNSWPAVTRGRRLARR